MKNNYKETASVEKIDDMIVIRFLDHSLVVPQQFAAFYGHRFNQIAIAELRLVNLQIGLDSKELKLIKPKKTSNEEGSPYNLRDNGGFKN